MLRRGWNVSTSHSLITRRLFATTVVLRIAPNERMSPETARKVKDEDKADIERERKLREQFAAKIQGAFGGGSQSQAGSSANSNGGSEGNGGGATGGWSQQGPFAAPSPGSMQFKLFRVLFFGFCIYVIVLMSNLRNPNSPMMQMQGQPWWQVPADALVLHALIKSLVSWREQRQIKNDYELAVKQNPTLTLAQFMSRSFPTLLSGHRTSQPEVVAALMAAHTLTRDLSFIDTITKATQAHPRDPKAAVDKLMESLKTDFPQIFAPLVPNPNWSVPQVQQQSIAGSAASGTVPQQFAPPQQYPPQYPPPQHQYPGSAPTQHAYGAPQQHSMFVDPQQQFQQQQFQTGMQAPSGVAPPPQQQTFVYNMSENATPSSK